MGTVRRPILATRATARSILKAVAVLHIFLLMRARERFAPEHVVDREDRWGNILREAWRQGMDLEDHHVPLPRDDPRN